MLISNEEIARMTKHQQKAKQIKYLQENGIKYKLDKEGWPWTTMDWVVGSENDRMMEASF